MIELNILIRYDTLPNMKNNYKVIVKTLPQDAPYDFEMSAALVIANYFKSDIVFLRPGHLKSPDLLINHEIWELKSPKGNSKNTIHNTIKGARKQSLNIIIDLRRCKLNRNKAISNIKDSYKKRKRKIGKFYIIDKNGKILDITNLT